MKKHLLLLILTVTFFACNQSKVSYNTPDQKEYINRWNALLRVYNETDNSVKKDEVIEKCTQLFNEHKSFTNWKGQVKEVNSFDDYAQLIIAQMRGQDERTTAEFHVNIYKNSPCYNLIKTLKESDEIIFSGTIDSEISITGNGKITEPELLVNCTNINGIENTLPENHETKVNWSCAICEKVIQGNGYEEVSEGVWEKCQDPIQCAICSPICGRKSKENLNKLIDKYEDGKTNDGKIYDENLCTLCKGTGIEKNTAQHILGGEEGRVCPMCEGKGRQGY